MTAPTGDAVELRAVLDTSAMLSYARPHIHVGELISEIAEEGAFVGLPTVALVDAHARLLDDEIGRARLRFLVTLPGVLILPLAEAAVDKVATAVPHAGGDLARAQAVCVALANRAYYVTTEPSAAPAILDDYVHAVPEDDAA